MNSSGSASPAACSSRPDGRCSARATSFGLHHLSSSFDRDLLRGLADLKSHVAGDNGAHRDDDILNFLHLESLGSDFKRIGSDDLQSREAIGPGCRGGSSRTSPVATFVSFTGAPGTTAPVLIGDQAGQFTSPPCATHQRKGRTTKCQQNASPHATKCRSH